MFSDSRDLRSSSSSTASPPQMMPLDDRMVTDELEAAEALADLAHLAMRGRDSGRRRTSKRVKSESPPPPPPLEVSESVTRCSDLPQETIASPLQLEKACPVAEPDCAGMNLKVEKDGKLLNTTSLVGPTGYLPLGCGAGKSRRNLSEAEKEERRMRRILANRESARQTIRRRQALCEELTKKASDLASENESLKREMDVALNEYQMLEHANKELKDQIAKAASAEIEEIPSDHKPECVQALTSSDSPLFLYNHPSFTPLFWPPVSQSQNPVQSTHIPQNTVLVPSHIPFPVEVRHDSCEQENIVNSSAMPPQPHFYVFPNPWFFPCADHGTTIQSQPLSFQKNEQEVTSLYNQYGAATSSRTVLHSDTTPHLFLPIKVKAEPSGSEARITNDLNEPPEGFLQDGEDQHTGTYLNIRMSNEPSLASSPMKHENGIQLDSTPRIETSSETCHTPLAPQEKFNGPVVFSCKKSAEAVAATEARKRRKELTKLKNLHGRQCRMHC